MIQIRFLIFVSAFFAFGFRMEGQWNQNSAINTPVCVFGGQQKNVSIVSDTKGGAIISWSDWRTSPNGDVYAQRLNYYGFATWQQNGVGVCTDAADQTGITMTEDGLGGVILTWNDFRNGNWDIYTQRLDSSGNAMWALNGVAVVSKSSIQKDPKILGDGAGGAFVVWEDSVGLGWDIYAQRISSTGTAQWASGGVSICSAVNSQINPKIQSDNAGGAIIVWQDKRNNSDYDILAQRINGSGVIQWTTNGTFIASLTGSQINPKIRPDGAGGAIIAWQDKRNGTDYDIYVQRVNASGVNQWTNNGVAVCVAAGPQSAIDLTTTQSSGEVIIGWKDERNGNLDIYAQKMNSSGTVAWTANGMVVCNSAAPQINPNLVTDGNGGAIVVWQDSTFNASDIYSQRISSSGAAMWTANGVPVATAIDNQTTPKNVANGFGGSIYAFEDNRNSIDDDIYAHHLDANGIVGFPEWNHQEYPAYCFPNPFASHAKITVSDERIMNLAGIGLRIFDLSGREVFFQVSKVKDGFVVERGAIILPGTYFYNLCSGDEVLGTGKVIILNP